MSITGPVEFTGTRSPVMVGLSNWLRPESAVMPTLLYPPGRGNEKHLFHLFGALAQYERALTRERVQAGLAAARRRGQRGGRPPALDPEKRDAVLAALNGGASKAAVCRTFGIPRSTLNDTLARAGWSGRGASS